MSDYSIDNQLRALNRQPRTAYYIADTSSHDLATNAYLVEFVTAGRIVSITNSLLSNDSDVTSADTMAAGTRIGGKISAITLGAGRAIAYCAPDYFFIA